MASVRNRLAAKRSESEIRFSWPGVSPGFLAY